MSTTAKDLRETFTAHCKHERHCTRAETSYWLSQYKDLASRAIQHAELVTAKLQEQTAQAEAAEALYAAPVPAPAVPAVLAVLAVPDGDDFNGSTPHLIQCMEALVRLDADGVLVPHSIGHSASKLLSAAANRMRQQAASSMPEEWRAVMQEAHDTFQRYADLHRAKDTRDSHEKAKANQKLANKLYALLQPAEARDD